MDAMTGTLGPRWSLAGRRALVTGASRGIGRAIAIGLAEAGADVVVHYLADHEAAGRTADAIVAAGQTAEVVATDLRVVGAGRALAELVRDRHGPIDIVVLNATTAGRRPFVEVGEGDISSEVQSGFGSMIEILQVLLPPMAERGWGRVVAIGSVQQVRQNPAVAVYAAMKSATANLVENLARLYGPAGVTLNTVAPGLIATDSTAPQLGQPETVAASLDEIPLRVIGQPEDCVGPVVLLCSEAGRYITGATLFVDGGMHLPGRPRFIGPDGRIRS
jgi:NAD(P)-dependent dehydrogenase (short-subunit alcohol dehydrogenase family)